MKHKWHFVAGSVKSIVDPPAGIFLSIIFISASDDEKSRHFNDKQQELMVIEKKMKKKKLSMKELEKRSYDDYVTFNFHLH